MKHEQITDRFVIEVQHSSDDCQDGKWFELERCATERQAIKLVEYFGTEKPIPQGIRPEQCIITGSYAGRPVRFRHLEE